MSETIQDTVDRLTAFVEQNFTDVETGPGSVISELLIKLASSIQNVQYNQVLALDQGASVSSVLANSETTYTSVIDKIASNYNTVRAQGTRSRGKIKVTISDENEYNLTAGLTFIQPALNLRYILTQDTRISLNLTDILEETQLYQQGGLYFFVLDVEAEDVGETYQVSSGTVFSLDTGYFINDFVKAEAYGNFSSASSTETDKQVIANFKANLGSRRFESPAGIANNFKSAFTSFQQLSVCGANDAEMLRSKRNVLGISTFGKADVYVRSSLAAETTTLVKRGIKGQNNLWTVQITSTDAPGFYLVKSVVPQIANIDLGGTLTPSVVYGATQYQSQRNNDNLSVTEARFTKYQTAQLQFAYDYTPPVDSQGQLSALFEIQLVTQPNILDMQDLLLLDSSRLACADYLVKAAVPCFVSLEITLLKKRAIDTYDSLNLQQLKKDIFNYINRIPFGEELYASSIIDLCHNYDIKRVDLPIKMYGTIVCPDVTNKTISLEDNDVLAIPNEPLLGVTPKTTAYFIDYYREEKGNANLIDSIALSLI